MKASIREIFCSAQGEGPYVGVKQAFVRFEGCNLSCSYCDTPRREDSKECMIETVPGSGEFISLTNPLSPEEVSAALGRYSNLHSISLTGGEPLLYADFIKELNSKTPLYLESNMSLPKEAEKIKNAVKYVSGDLKLREAHSSTHYEKYLEDMTECFKILRKTKDRDCFCKVVLVKGFKKEEVLMGVSLIEDLISCLVLQPVTPTGKAKTPSPKDVLSLQEELSYIDTRIIPQSHVIWGAR